MSLNLIVYQIRPFIYFDIISWLESKIEHINVQETIKEKVQKKITDNE